MYDGRKVRQKTFNLPEHSYGQVVYSTHRSREEFSYFQKMKIAAFEATIFRVTE